MDLGDGDQRRSLRDRCRSARVRGTERQRNNGDGSAIAYIVVGVLIDGFCVFILFAMYKVVRQRLRRRRQPISGLATG